MRPRFTLAVLMTVGLAVSACSGEGTASPSSSVTDLPVERQAGITGGGGGGNAPDSPVAVQNELGAYWSEQGIPITWKVSEVDNHDWAGNLRPDHAPPNGFQGLKQDAFSGAYRVPLEWNSSGFEIRFVLTPIVSVDGQSMDLQPITFTGYAGTSNAWYMEVDGTRIQCSQYKVSSYPVSTWHKLPNGKSMWIDYDFLCSPGLATVVMRSW